MSATPIYLGKDGKISGPFTQGQIEELRQNGELYNYAWIWDVKSKGWKAIEEEVDPEVEASIPSLPPPAAASDAKATVTASLGQALANQAGLKPTLENIHVICHNPKIMVSGKLTVASQNGCKFRSLLSFHSVTTFKIGMKVVLNLLDVTKNTSENVRATVRVVKRGDEFWEYELAWDRLPQIIG